MNRQTGPSLRRADGVALLVCVLTGLLLSLYPHLRAFVERGDPVFVADRDELEIYLPISTRAYQSHPFRLEDPVPRGGGRTLFPWPQLGPGILLARALGWGPLGVSIAWRLLAGFLIGGLTYLTLRQRLARPAVACALTLVLLADLGLVFGKPLLQHLGEVGSLLRGETGSLSGSPKLHANWRLITPALSLPWVLLAILLWLRHAQRPTLRRRALAGVALGALVGVYFYHWTAAALGLGLWFLLVRERRKEALHLAWIAAAVGLPALIAGALLKVDAPPDWLLRSDKFIPIAHSAELSFPKSAFLLAGVLFPWVWFRRRDLLPLACVAGGALLLLNHQLLSGLQIENWHWQYAYGPLLCLLLAFAVGITWERRWPSGAPLGLSAALAVLILLFVASGLYLRHAGCDSAVTLQLNERLSEYRQTHAGAPRAGEKLVAGERNYVALAAAIDGARPLAGEILRFSPSLSAVAWEERIALNGALLGQTPGEFRAGQDALLRTGFFTGLAKSTPGGREELVTRRVRLFMRARGDLAATSARLGVGEVALPAQASAAHLPRGWRRLRGGPRWVVWGPPQPY
ncbi:MAG: hypothetical protein JKY65_14380 [Planctomycetes bacterium]|nr:hypothetical protein [Planctomycetota bacterium]